MVAAFISHNSEDKEFVRMIARDLDAHGIKCWVDEAEMKVGDSLIKKIEEGIDASNYFIIIISKNSVKSNWVNKELELATITEFEDESIKVLPVILNDIDSSNIIRNFLKKSFLRTKFYCLFNSNKNNYESEFKKLVKSMGGIFNKGVFNLTKPENNLGAALRKMEVNNFQILAKPFHRPYQYLGMSIQNAENQTGGKSNEVGNIIIDHKDAHMLLEAEGNMINYVEVDLKATQPHYQSKNFDPEMALGALSINPAELDKITSLTHCHSYSDHKRKLKVSVACSYDGAPLTISFGSKYYGL